MNKPRYKGTLSVTPRGFGFVTTDIDQESREVFIAPNFVSQLVPGDTISFTVGPGKREGQLTADDVQLVERKPTIWVGTPYFQRGDWVLNPDKLCFSKLAIRGSVQHLSEDMVIAVRVTDTGMRRFQTCQLEAVLGPRGGHKFELDYALTERDFPMHFDFKVYQEISKMADSVAVDSSAKDLTTTPFITVDGVSTKDFDDAVFCEKTPTGWHVMVAIADVSFYVTPGSALDNAAFQRSTSVYLPFRVSPMLPDALSNGLCSLIPNQTRRAVVADMYLNETGDVLPQSSVYRAFIQSHARVTYDEMTDMLEGKLAGSLPWSQEVVNNMTEQAKLYEILEAHQKFQIMEFEDAEPYLIRDDSGEFDIEWHHRTISHKVVEQMMLLANRYVATRVNLFRHQSIPSAENWAKLKAWAATHSVQLADEPSLSEISKLFAAVPEQLRDIAELKVRLIMEKAVYSPINSAHFALGFNKYTHFTSPIRRYADLAVHRQLLDKKSARPDGLAALQQVSKATHMSERGNAARLVERDVWDRIKKRILFRKHQGQVLSGYLSFSLSRGWLVSFKPWNVTALVRNEELVEAGYSFVQETQSWLDSDGKPVELGTKLNVKILSLNEETQRVDLNGSLDINE